MQFSSQGANEAEAVKLGPGQFDHGAGDSFIFAPTRALSFYVMMLCARSAAHYFLLFTQLTQLMLILKMTHLTDARNATQKLTQLSRHNRI